MKELFAEKFKSARMMNGFSLKDLSEKMENKISRQALHKYEKGEVIPNSEMMDILCTALNVRPDYFTRDTLVKLGKIEFRKLERLPVKEQNSIIEKTKDELSRYLELEEILNIKKRFEHPVDKKFRNIKSPDDIEDFTSRIREKWEIGSLPISNVSELLEENNIKLIEIHANDDFDGLKAWANSGEIPVIVLNIEKLKSLDRKRFTALHELGHLLMPLDGLDKKTAESYCHRFAGSMLMPKEVVYKEIGKKRTKITIQELGFVKKEFGISIQALIYRLADLGVISDYYKSYYYKYINQMGWKETEPYEYKGTEESHRFDQLILRALSEEIITMSKAASLKNMKLSEFRETMLKVE